MSFIAYNLTHLMQISHAAPRADVAPLRENEYRTFIFERGIFMEIKLIYLKRLQLKMLLL